MRHEDRTIGSVGSYIDHLRATATDGLVWFRGQRCVDWSLLPNIARAVPGHPNGLLDHEIPAIKRFKQNADAFLQRLPSTEWEWIFLMQHHRGLTRLLDWSESPLVALYFALDDCADEQGTAKDGVVWCLDPMGLNRHSGHHREHARDILAFGIDDQLDNYLPDRIGGNVGAQMRPIAAIGPRNSRRMIAQSGTFTIMHRQQIAIDAVEDGSHVWRMLVPAESKVAIREELKLLGFNEFMMFPDLETLVLHTKELLQ